MTKRSMYALLVLLLLPITVCAASPLPAGIIAVKPVKAPSFMLETMDGEKQNLDASQGKWAFVHFWASWCGPCRKEMPAIQEMVAYFKNKPLAIYIINTAEDDDTVFEFLASTAAELQTLMDRDGLVTEQWQPRGLPATYLVDTQGIIRYQALGGRDWHSPAYRGFIEKLLAIP